MQFSGTVSAWFSLRLRSVRCVKQVLNVSAVVKCHVSQTVRPKGATSARQLLEHARNPATPEPTAARHTATYTARQQQCTAVHAADVMNCQGLIEHSCWEPLGAVRWDRLVVLFLNGRFGSRLKRAVVVRQSQARGKKTRRTY